MRSKTFAAVLGAALTAGAFQTAAPVTAQQAPVEVRSSRFSAEPFAGIYFDEFAGTTFDRPEGVRERRPGILGGLKLGYSLSERARLTSTLGYAEVNDFGRFESDAENYFVYGQNSWLATGGVEMDVLPGRTSASIGLEVGAAADIEEREGVVGDPSQMAEQEYSRYLGGSYGPIRAAVVPQISVAHELTSAATIRLSLRDYLLVDDAGARGRPAVTFGISLGSREPADRLFGSNN